MVDEKYLQYVQKLGSGTHGNVYLLKTKDKQPKFLVCKTISLKNLKYAEKEIKILHKIHHQRIISFYHSIEKKHGKYIYMEYANYGDLEKLIKFLSKKNLRIQRNISWSIFAQIVDGLEYLQSKKILHRDIKPANILLSRFFNRNRILILIKIADFSLSKIMDEKNIHDNIIVGTPYYMAPEIIKKEKYDYSIDIWSTGVLMYELIALERPFEAETKMELRRLIVHQKIEDVPKCSDDYLKQTILDCLKKENRITAKQMKNNRIHSLYINKNNKNIQWFKQERILE
ncbi:NEK protein kinase [Pseudoloma neurophilia]|uniref:non-specific serine/threonine protein kinase n=1 Tax=Pseudoloma neurophilia TaxID=146866 RepID=A0A0R0M6K6_9MICR|nr:NEK protein kinase [Pseudoloma neurophilia]